MRRRPCSGSRVGLATLATQSRAGTRVSMPSALSEAMSDCWLGLGLGSGLGLGLGSGLGLGLGSGLGLGLGVLGVGVRAMLPDVCSGSMPHVTPFHCGVPAASAYLVGVGSGLGLGSGRG